jgi:hypothetical protein
MAKLPRLGYCAQQPSLASLAFSKGFDQNGGQAHMVRFIHGLSKVLPGPAMPCWRATPETDLRPFWG